MNTDIHRRPVSDRFQSPSPHQGPGVLRPESRPELRETTAALALEVDASRKGRALRQLQALADANPALYADPGFDGGDYALPSFLHAKRVDAERRAILTGCA